VGWMGMGRGKGECHGGVKMQSSGSGNGGWDC